MFDSTQSAQQSRPIKFCAAQWKVLNGPQLGRGPTLDTALLVKNWISHWCKVSCFHWTTLMQDTLVITCPGYEYGFIWLYASYSILVQWKNTTQVHNSGVTDGNTRVQTSPLTSKCKNWAPILFIFRYSVLLWFSVSCCFLRFSEVFGLLFSGDFGF